MRNRKASIIILASSEKTDMAFRIADLVKRYTGEDLCRICFDTQEVQRVRHEASGYCCGAVLLVADAQELDRWGPLAPLLDDLAVMVWLPDGRQHTMAMTHRLRPHYLMMSDSNYGELLAVIGDILARHRIPGAALRDHNPINAWALA